MPTFTLVTKAAPTAATPLVAAVDPFTQAVFNWVIRWQIKSNFKYPSFLAPFSIDGHGGPNRIPQPSPGVQDDAEFEAWLNSVGGRIVYDPATGLISVAFSSKFADP